MRASARLFPVVVVVSILAGACGAPPTADAEAARASLERASGERASQYAPEAMKEAQAAQAALDAELQAQDAKWFKSYDRARELAAAAKAAGDRAVADAAAGREKAEARAAREKVEAAARAKAARAAPVRVGGQIKPPTKIKDVAPVYPAIARDARVQGAVVVEATIGPDGKVEDARVVRSIPLLDQAALDAVKQWEYMPTLLNGVPTPVVVTVTINFTRS